MLKRIVVLAVAGLLTVNVSANDILKDVSSKLDAAAKMDAARHEAGEAATETVKGAATTQVEAAKETVKNAITPAVKEMPKPAAAPAKIEKIDINTADAKTLEKVLDGIGTKKAEAIVKYRTEKGPFTKVEDLLKVDGVGETVLKKNMDKLMVVPPTTKAAAPAPVTMPAPTTKMVTPTPAKAAEPAHK